MSTLDETGLLSFPTDEETVRKNDMAHVLHSWAAQGHIDAVPIAGGEGAWFWDPNGRRYLDFSSQLVNVNIGYQHPRLVAAVQEQAGRMLSVSPAFATTRGPRRHDSSRTWRLATSTWSSSPAAAPRPTRWPSGWRGCTPAGTRSSPPTAATTGRQPEPRH